jgi:hypothetical protein
MSIRFRIGPFTFGKTGTRLSPWRRSSGFSIPLTNRKKAQSFGKVKLGPFSFYLRGKSKKQKSKKALPDYIQETKEAHKQAYEPWTKELDEQLISLFRKGRSVQELSEAFGRTKGAIRSRIEKLLLQ